MTVRFNKISITKSACTLVRETKDKNGAVEAIELTSPERALSSFIDALQAFTPFVVELLEMPAAWRDHLTITTLNLSEDKNGLRGLIVTAIRPVPKAYNKPLVLNTPLVRQGGENPLPDAFVLSDVVMDLIETVEAEAARYANGERVQGELFAKAQSEASENSKSFNDRAAAAETKSTRKGKKASDQKPGVGLVMNPDAIVEDVTDDQVRQLLMMVERDVPVDAIVRWTSSERNSAIVWAKIRQRELAGSLKPDETVPKEPNVIKASATMPLLPTKAATAATSRTVQ